MFNVSEWLRDAFGWDLPFDIRIHTYAICLLLGMVAAALITDARLHRRGTDRGAVLDVALWAIIFGIIGARAWHVLTHPDDYFGADKNPLEILAIQNGGIAIFGSLVGGAVGAWIGCRLSGLRFWTFADALAPGLLVAQALGRLGNYFNHELFGTPTDLPWGLEIESSNPAFPAGLEDGTLFHPTFLYEMLWNLFGVVLILLIEREYRLQWGKVFGLYLIWYGLGRSWFESIRVDPSELFLGIRSNVWGAFLAIFIGVVILFVQSRRHPGREPGPYMPGREPERSAEVDSDDTYSEEDEIGDVAEESTETPATSGAGTKS
nr:prolipoprotein diacylglyceryl transferase [Diaminobutyricimonas aerilata]